MDKIFEKACDAIESIENSKNWNIMDTADRKLISELIDLKKNILKVEKLDDEVDGKYSEMMPMSYRNRKRDRMGRYSSSAKDDIMMEIEEMMALATDEPTKAKIRKFKRELEMM